MNLNVCLSPEQMDTSCVRYNYAYSCVIATVLQYYIHTITYLRTSMNKKRMNSFQELCA